MRSIKIVGGPAPQDIRIYDADGKDLSEYVRGLEIAPMVGDLKNQLLTAKLTVWASLDIQAITEEIVDAEPLATEESSE